MPKGPELVELARIWRGPVVESVHHGIVAVADTAGTLRHAWGDPGFAPTPRSALKPFQAVALVESGAADALGLTDEHIALACASHHAQPFQVALVTDWLGRLGMTENALICGPALPNGVADQGAAWASGGPRRVYHNCSGKHCGFLSVAKHMGAGLDYGNPDHPAQRLYRDVLSEFTGMSADGFAASGDGCGLPALSLPIGVMAKAMARLGVAQAVSPARRAAARRVLGAMAAYPDHLAGKDSPLAVVSFWVGKKGTPTWKSTDPTLVFSRPKGANDGPPPEAGILVDWYLANVELGEGKHAIEAVLRGPGIEGESKATIRAWTPWRLRNPRNGEYQLRMTLVDKDGKPVPGAWNDVTRKFTVNTQAPSNAHAGHAGHAGHAAPASSSAPAK